MALNAGNAMETFLVDLKMGREPNYEALAGEMAMKGPPIGLPDMGGGVGLQAPANAQQIFGNPQAPLPAQQGLQAPAGAQLGQLAAPVAPGGGMNWAAILQGLQMVGAASGAGGAQPQAPTAPAPQGPSFQMPKQTFSQSIYGG